MTCVAGIGSSSAEYISNTRGQHNLILVSEHFRLFKPTMFQHFEPSTVAVTSAHDKERYQGL